MLKAEPREMTAEAWKLVELLEHVLRNQIAAQQALLGCLAEKRVAVRTADAGALGEACQRERSAVSRMEELELQRGEVIRRLTAALGMKASGAVKISVLSERIGGAGGVGLKAISGELREAVMQVQKESSVLKSAMEALSRRLEGIVESVNGAMSRAKVYSRKGRIAVGVQLAGTVDLKS